LVWRENHSLLPNASFSVRDNAGHSLKSSISHAFAYNDLDCEVLPTKGLRFSINQEIAGLGGNIGFFKNELSSRFTKQLGCFVFVI
jgi:outer membrane protein insertion porin family